MRAVFQRGRELSRVYGRVLRDLFALSKGRVVTVLFFHTLGPLLLGAMIVVLTGAIRIITKKAEVDEALAESEPPAQSAGGFGDILGADVSSFAGVAGAVTLLGLLGAILCWRAMYISRKLARDYRVSLTGRMIERVAGYPVETAEVDLEIGQPSNLSTIFLRGPLQSSIAARLVLTLVRPVIMVVSFNGVLFFLSWKLAVILIPLLLLPMPLIYALNRSTHGASHRFYLGGGRKRFSDVLKDCLGQVNEAPVSSRQLGSEVRKSYEENDEVNRALDDYDFSILARTRSQYYTSVFQAILIGAGVFGFGLAAIRGWHSWEIIVGALIALKGVQQAVTVLWGMVASLVRKFPVVRNTQQFIDAMDADESDEDRKEDESKESHHYLISSPLPAVRTTVPGLLSMLRRSGETLSIESGELLLVTKTQPAPEEGDWLGGWDGDQAVTNCFSAEGDARTAAWESIPVQDRVRALIAAGLSDRTRLIVLHASPGCVYATREWISQMDGSLDLISVCRGWPDDQPLEDFVKVIAHDGEAILREAPGSEWAEHREMLAEQLRAASSDFDDSDLDDDDDE